MSLLYYFLNEWPGIHKSHIYYYIIPILLIAFSVLSLRLFLRQKRRLPPGPIGLPLVGYLPFLGKEPFRVLHNLCKKYGNVYSMYLGRTYVVILGDYTAAKEALGKTSSNDRPPGIFDFLPDSIGFTAANGTEWVEQRRFVVRSMKEIGLGRSTWACLVEDDVSDFLRMLEEKKGAPIDIEHSLNCSTSGNVGSLIFGKRLPPGPDRDTLIASIDRVMTFFSHSGLWNYFPWICNMLVKLRITRYYKTFCEFSEFNKIIRKTVDMHKKSLSGRGNATDFISTYVEATIDNVVEGKETTFHERNLIGNTQTLYTAGSDTARGSILWLFLAMAAYRKVQEKVHRELDSVLGKKQRAVWEDRAKFPYIYAVIMEGQRWKTIAPLNPPRAASEDLTICGYDIPKGSTIVVNNWGLHNDTRYWSEPEEFIPDRFLQNDGKEVILKPESYTPFSQGKRRCPGETVALMEIFLYFTAIMQKFEVKAPNGRSPNLDAIVGLTYQPVPQNLCYMPR